MVDFESDATVARPAADIVRILILQRRNDLIDALEEYRKADFHGVQASLRVVRARLNSLFTELEASLKRRHDKEGPSPYKELRSLIKEGDTIEEVEEAMSFINEELDNWKLTRIDTIKQYDSTDAETENSEKGL